MAGSDNQGEQLDRRRFVQATGMVAGGVLASGGDALVRSPGEHAALTAQTTSTSAEGLALGPGQLALGGRLVVGAGGYDTIQAAWDDAASGDVIYVHASYDAQAAGEQFPIVLDYGQKEVMLTGPHPGGAVVDAGSADANVIEVLGRGRNDYRNNPTVRNLEITGGQVGLRVRAAPHASFADIVCFETGSHGVEVDGYTDPETGNYWWTPGPTFRRVVTWGCGGNGFRLNTGANPRWSSLLDCHALFNRRPGVHLRGDSVRLCGGVVRNNETYGVDARNGSGQLISGVYFEGNGTHESHPVDLYVDDTAPGLTVDACYFSGRFRRDFQNGLDDAATAIAVDGGSNTDVRNCTYRRYTDAFVTIRDAADVDVHRPSHAGLDGTRFLRAQNYERLRSNGVVQESDLRNVSGRYRGDLGIHDGSGGPWGPAVWNGTDWTSVMDGQVLS